jgi:hypothetical protein
MGFVIMEKYGVSRVSIDILISDGKAIDEQDALEKVAGKTNKQGGLVDGKEGPEQITGEGKQGIKRGSEDSPSR